MLERDFWLQAYLKQLAAWASPLHEPATRSYAAAVSPIPKKSKQS